MKKQIKQISIFFILVLIVFFIIEHIVFVSIAKSAIKYMTALEPHMNRIIINPFKASVTIRGLKIFNPPGFPDNILANVPLIVMDYQPRTFFKKGVFLDKITVYIKELNIIRNKDNIVNLSKIKALTPSRTPKDAAPFYSGRYTVEIEKVRYIDYTKDEKDRIKEIDLNIKEEYKNIKNADNIANATAFKIFFDGKLGNIGVDIVQIQKGLANLAEGNKKLKEELAKLAESQVEKAKEIIAEQAGRTKDVMKNRVEYIKDKIDKTKEAVKERIGEVKDRPEDKDKE